jgi:hypothetical protein
MLSVSGGFGGGPRVTLGNAWHLKLVVMGP